MKIKFTTSEKERLNRESSMIQRKKIMSLYQFMLKASLENGEQYKYLKLSLNQLLGMLTKGGKVKNISRASLHARIKKLEKFELVEITQGKGQEPSIYKFDRIKHTGKNDDNKNDYIPVKIENEFTDVEDFFGSYDLEEIEYYSNTFIPMPNTKLEEKQDSSNRDFKGNENNFNEVELKNKVLLDNKIKSSIYTSNETVKNLENKGIDYQNYIENSLDKVRDFSLIEKYFNQAIKILRLRKNSRAYEEALNNLKNNYYNITEKYAFNYVLKVVESVKVKYQLIREEFAKKIMAAKKFKKQMELNNFKNRSRFCDYEQRDTDYDSEPAIFGF